MDGLVAEFGHGMVRTGRESRRMALPAARAAKQRLALQSLRVGQAATSADTEKRDVRCPIREVVVGGFDRSTAGITVENRENRGRYTHVSVQCASDLMADSGLRTLVGEPSETQ